MTGRNAHATRYRVSPASRSPGDRQASLDVSRCSPGRAHNGSGSGQAGDELANGLAAAGVERDLDPGMQPRLGAPQVAHQVQDPVQLIGLEGEYPLVVVEREAGNGIRPDVRVLA